MDQQIIDEFEHGGQKLREAVAGLSRRDLLWVPPADAEPALGRWSIQQVVIHLMDSDLVGIDRMKRIIAEDNPLLIGYNETRFAERLFYNEQSTQDAITILDLSRRQFAGVLRRLSPETFDRTGVHNEVGRVTLAEQVKKYNQHLEHHLGFIRRKRAKLGT
ncbi:DinB family protein [Fontivita pretiosa]|uniref:DinB family protein n=1 Tax=Fontivita pretiosa TaxID=2989684 RepID=UPI003D168D67